MGNSQRINTERHQYLENKIEQMQIAIQQKYCNKEDQQQHLDSINNNLISLKNDNTELKQKLKQMDTNVQEYEERLEAIDRGTQQRIEEIDVQIQQILNDIKRQNTQIEQVISDAQKINTPSREQNTALQLNCLQNSITALNTDIQRLKDKQQEIVTICAQNKINTTHSNGLNSSKLLEVTKTISKHKKSSPLKFNNENENNGNNQRQKRSNKKTTKHTILEE